MYEQAEIDAVNAWANVLDAAAKMKAPSPKITASIIKIVAMAEKQLAILSTTIP